MGKKSKTNKYDQSLLITLLLTTLAVVPNIMYDLFNLPKLIVLSIAGFGYLFLLLSNWKLITNKKLFLLCLLFIIWSIIVIFASNAPIDQQIFGFFGRNTGFLTYFCLTIIFLYLANIGSSNSKTQILKALRICTLINALYVISQYFGFDFTNLGSGSTGHGGTFGNPDFAAAFLGIGSSALFCNLLFSGLKNKKFDISIVILSIVSSVLTGTKQGVVLVVAGISLTFVIYFYLKNRNLIFKISLACLSLFGGIGVAGLVGKGPASKFLYDETIIFRGDYWRAGISMFKSNPFFGVGFDSYSDWYRHSRDQIATLRTDPERVTSVAHNVFIDFAANGGIFLFALYIAIFGASLIVFIKRIKNRAEIETLDVVLFIGLFTYLLQSIISINNIGLAVWGWVFAGSAWIKFKNDSFQVQKNIFIPVAGAIVGLLISIQPSITDVKFLNAMRNNDTQKLNEVAYRWPNTTKYVVEIINRFNTNGDKDNLVRLTNESILKNNRVVVYWKVLYAIGNSNEKTKAQERLKYLDPFNPNIT